MRTADLGPLNCTIIDPARDAGPKRLVILSHGFGAPGGDLVPLANELIHLDPDLAKDTRWIFPAAPLSLDSRGMYGGRAWWMIDLEARIAAIERGEIETFRNDYPEGMAEASDALFEVAEAALDEAALEPKNLIIGGFSQGSMVSTDVALRMEQPPAALAVMSGTLLCEDRWKELAGNQEKFPVLQTHGYYDPILPYQCAEWLKEFFEDAGYPVDFRPFAGQHQIPMTALEGLVKLIGASGAGE